MVGVARTSDIESRCQPLFDIYIYIQWIRHLPLHDWLRYRGCGKDVWESWSSMSVMLDQHDRLHRGICIKQEILCIVCASGIRYLSESE